MAATSESRRIDILCIEAIEHLRKKMEREYEKEYKTNRIFHFVEASKVLGVKYFQMHFQNIPIKDVMLILNSRQRR